MKKNRIFYLRNFEKMKSNNTINNAKKTFPVKKVTAFLEPKRAQGGRTAPLRLPTSTQGLLPQIEAFLSVREKARKIKGSEAPIGISERLWVEEKFSDTLDFVFGGKHYRGIVETTCTLNSLRVLERYFLEGKRINVEEFENLLNFVKSKENE